MRYEPNKAFPHPVLRPLIDGGQSADFPGYGFQTAVEPEVSEDRAYIELRIAFEVKHPDIVRAIEQGRAEYAVLIYCNSTYYRMYVGSSEPRLTVKITAGDVDRSVELRPSVVVSDAMDRYDPDGLHEELRGRIYRVQAGGLLAQDYAVDFPAGREFLRPITSIFQITPDPKQPVGKFDIQVGDPVQIIVNPEDNAKLAAARRSGERRPTVMNAVYLPAVMALLSEAVRLEDDTSGDRWFEVVQYKAVASGMDWSRIKDGRISLWDAAQTLLNGPARHLDFMREDA